MDQRNAAIQKEGCQGLTNERIEKRAASSGARVSEQARSLQKREEGRREGGVQYLRNGGEEAGEASERTKSGQQIRHHLPTARGGSILILKES